MADTWEEIRYIVVALCIAATISTLVYNIRVYQVEYLKAGYVKEIYEGQMKKP